MSLRLTEVFLPEEKGEQAETLLEKYTFLDLDSARFSSNDKLKFRFGQKGLR